MKTIKENWKLVLIVAAGIVAVIFMCIFGIQGAQNKAFALEEQVNTADSDIKVQLGEFQTIFWIGTKSTIKLLKSKALICLNMG